MNICISTVYDSVNCGAFLQAYALKKELERMGHNVYHLKYTSEKERKNFIFERDDISLFQYIKRHFGYTGKNYRIYKNALKYFKEIKSDELENMDLLIVGSDELWNVTNSSIIRYINMVELGSTNKIAYAISCGNATHKEIISNKKLLEQIKEMNCIFVRDERTKENVEIITNKECKQVCDPTFLIDIDCYETNHYKKIKTPYIMYYGYWTRKNTFSLVERYAREKKIELDAIGLNNPKCHKSINCHPLNFISYIKDAELFVTSTFHGTIFGILNHKDFVCIDTDSEKVKDLLERLGLENRLLTETSTYKDLLNIVNRKIDYKRVDKKIREWRKESQELLELVICDMEKKVNNYER